MAYNTKYILNYCNKHNDRLTIELQVEGYVGKAFIIVNNEDYLTDDQGRFITTNIDGNYDPDRDKNKIEGSSNPFSLTYRNDRGEKGGAIRATSATMEFFEDMMFNIDDLATSDETELKCVFKYNDKIEWIGFVTPDFFNVEITSNPVVSLTASDRIGILKDVDYPVTTLITDKVSKLSILAKCLYETGLDLPINIVCDMYCDQFAGEDVNPFAGSFVSEWRAVKDVEKGDLEKCYTILQALMDEYNCLLTQYKGEWWVVNKYNLEKGGGAIWRYEYDGAPISKSTVKFGETFFSLIDTGGERTIIPAGAKNTYLLNNGPDMIYPLNYNFQTYAGNTPEYWNDNGLFFVKTRSIPISYLPNGNVDQYYLDTKDNVRITDYIYDSNEQPIIYRPWNSRNITSLFFNTGSVSGKTLSLNMSIKGIGRYKTGLLVSLCIYFPGSDLLFTNAYEDDREWYVSKLSSINVPPSNPSGNIPVKTFDFPDKFKDPNVAVRETFSRSKNTSISDLRDAASRFSLTLPEDDFSTAVCFVKVFQAFTRDSSIIADVVLKEVKVAYANDDQTPKGTVFQTTLEGRFTKPTERRNLMWGDFQTFGQNGYFYKYREDSLSITYNEYGDQTKDWYTPFDTTRQPLMLHSLRQLTQSYARAHDELRIGFELDRIDPFTQFAVRCVSQRYILVNDGEDYLNDNKGKYITTNIGKYLNKKRFILVEGTIDYLRSSFSGVLAEIVNTERETKEYIYSYFEDSNIK